MSHGKLPDGRWYYECKICGKPPVIMDNGAQAKAADDLHALAHRDKEEDSR